jgi:hypothetical protein
MVWSIVLDLVVSLLLVLTIGYAVLLNRRLGSLRRQRAELESGTTAFQAAIKSAEDSIARLKVTAEGLQATVDKAAAAQNDLFYLIERSEGLADRLETGVRASRAAPGSGSTSATVRNLGKDRSDPPLTAAKPATAGVTAGPAAGAAKDRAPRSETERALLRALAGGR